MKDHASGLADKEKTGDLMELEGDLLLTGTLPEGVRQSLSGASPGEYLLYASPQGPFYVLFVKDRKSSSLQPFEAVKDSIGKKLYNEKRKSAVEAYARKLREASEVKILFNNEQLEKLISNPGR
jgi:hypothetical protein